MNGLDGGDVAVCFQEEMQQKLWCVWSYYVPEWVRFDWILSSQGNTTEDDEDEDEVGEVGVMDEVVACNSQTDNEKEKWIIVLVYCSIYHYFVELG